MNKRRKKEATNNFLLYILQENLLRKFTFKLDS